MAGEETESNVLVFFVNGKKVSRQKVDPDMTLLTFLRNELGLTGTKLGCAEGGCGACTVMVSAYDAQSKSVNHMSVNACLAPLCSMHGLAVTTVEGIGSTKTRLHPVQERIARSHGSQCGFCTPGIVMSMYTLMRNNSSPTYEDMESAFEGNLCRCTGYRPILEGLKTFTKDGGCALAASGQCCQQRKQCCQAQSTLLQRSEKLFNASDFTPLDPTQEPIFPPELMVNASKPPESVCFVGPRSSWYRPVTLAELLALKSAHPYARIVAGNSEVGVEVKFKHQLYTVFISPFAVPELNVLRSDERGLTVGAAVSLSAMGKKMRELVGSCPEYQMRTFSAVLEMLRWFAGHQIRNVAAIGGNIMTASPISDLNPLFVAAGATLTFATAEGKQREVRMDRSFFTGYRKVAVGPDEVLISIFIPFTHETEYVFSYKQARRRDDDIAIVNAGMRVLLSDSQEGRTVKECSLSYGGMAATTVVAEKAQQFLIGKTWSPELVDQVCPLLLEDLPIDASAPGGMVEYRRALTLSFFFKFYTAVSCCTEAGLVPQPDTSAAQLFHRPPTEGVQLFQEVPESQKAEDVVGRPMMHLAAEKQVSGEAIYVDDMPHFKDEVYLAFVFSSFAHAKIKSIDESLALTMPGVVDFVSSVDVPGSNKTGPVIKDEEVYASKEVHCVGQIVGAILADTKEHAQVAARTVKIEYEQLPSIVTIEEAIAADSFMGKEINLKRGDPESAFNKCDHVLEGEMRVGGQEHFYLETQATIAVPKGEDGEMEIFSSSQSPNVTQILAAAALGVPFNRVVARIKRMGGGFGGKETRNCPFSTAVAVAAHKVGRPVRMMLDRDEDMSSSGQRHPFLARYKVGFSKEGKILALKLNLYSNGGCSMDLSTAVLERAVLSADNCYDIPSLHIKGRICRTHLPSNTAFRGFGAPQGMMFIESIVTDVAVVCELPQDKVREMNFYKEGAVLAFGQKLELFHALRCWSELRGRCRWDEQEKAVAEFNSSNRWKKRGIAVTPTKFGISFTATFLNQAAALVHVYTDGSVLLAHGGTEMGQGLHTKMVQVCSRALGIPTSMIHISETSTSLTPNVSPTAASASSDLNGMAIKVACDKILANLKPYMEKKPDGSWQDWVRQAYFDRVGLSANGFYRTPDVQWDTNDMSKSGNRPFNYFAYGSACSMVEIDTLTGDYQVLRTDIVMDVGCSLNPAIDIGQVEGAFVQGLGLFTLEESVHSPQGFLFSRGPGAYKIPGFSDIPVKFNVSLLRSAPNDRAIYSSKAVGEPPLFLAASVFYAIKDAIMAARAESGVTGVFRLDSPATAERIRMACVDKFTKQIPVIDPVAKRWNVRP